MWAHGRTQRIATSTLHIDSMLVTHKWSHIFWLLLCTMLCQATCLGNIRREETSSKMPAGGWGSCRAGSAPIPHAPVSMGLGRHWDSTLPLVYKDQSQQQKRRNNSIIFFLISSPNTFISLKTFLPLQPAFVFFFHYLLFSSLLKTSLARGYLLVQNIITRDCCCCLLQKKSQNFANLTLSVLLTPEAGSSKSQEVTVFFYVRDSTLKHWARYHWDELSPAARGQQHSATVPWHGEAQHGHAMGMGGSDSVLIGTIAGTSKRK